MKEGILSATGKTLSLSDPSRKGQGEYKCYHKNTKRYLAGWYWVLLVLVFSCVGAAPLSRGTLKKKKKKSLRRV